MLLFTQIKISHPSASIFQTFPKNKSLTIFHFINLINLLINLVHQAFHFCHYPFVHLSCHYPVSSFISGHLVLDFTTILQGTIYRIPLPYLIFTISTTTQNHFSALPRSCILEIFFQILSIISYECCMRRNYC